MANDINTWPDPPQRPKKKTLPQGIKETFFEYCSNTSIHGIKFFGENRSWTERIIWICVFIASLYWCIDALKEIADKYRETPVIVSFSEKSTDIWNIPFPAVTICSEIKRTQRSGPSYSDLSEWYDENPHDLAKNLSSTDLHEFLTMLQICPLTAIENDVRIPLAEPLDFFQTLDEMLPDFEITFPICAWFYSEAVECERLLTKTYTEEGICYTFNALNATDLYRENTVQYERMGLSQPMDSIETLNRTLSWTLAEGYAENSPLFTYPARILKSGAKTGLHVVVRAFKNDSDSSCTGPMQGLKILLHAPDDVQMVSESFIRLSMQRQVSIAVKPQMTTTSKNIEAFTPAQRQCQMPDERYLRFFKVYTEKNCELECLTNFTLAQCGCVRFAMPRTWDMPVCREDQMECYASAEGNLSAMFFSSDFKESTNKCNCLPACTSLDYDVEISEGNFKAEAIGEQYIDDLEYAAFHIYFKDNKFFTSHRSELYGYYDFIASCGGIFGLFMGVSLLSVFEILYHVTLRLWNNYKEKKY
ncbi:pickpocket protein 28 [Musca domestica]|uniref:Pickpocket protein 28 n=1 Tax=Musca domestica TaxID=7370 RepID=A0A9J7IBQ0_MUSDO|nr:pickpocket protein 28 [Musca domestica]XP_019890551.2 pickpocket protein 28 [Musca domestica]XP_019890552.2 pickpocket protein 28 [Musca domestica]